MEDGSTVCGFLIGFVLIFGVAAFIKFGLGVN